jgi:hypothetical protein
MKVPGRQQGARLKGFFSGLLWGSVFSAIGLAFISQMTLMPAGGIPGPLLLPGESLSGPSGGVAAPVSPQPPQDEMPEQPASAPQQPGAGQTAAEVPQAVQVPPGSEFIRPLPDVIPTLPGITAAPAGSVTPLVDAPGQGSSVPETDPGPGRAPAPVLLAPAAGAAPETPEAKVAVPDRQDGLAPQSPLQPPGTPVIEPGPAPVNLPPPPPLTPEEQAIVAGATIAGPEVPTDPQAVPLPPDPMSGPVGPQPGSEGNPVSGDAAGAAGLPAASLSGAAQQGEAGRLPPSGVSPPADPALRAPISRLARAFSNPQGKPVLAIVLIDRGDPGLDRAALAALPFPLTFVLDPTLPGVAQLAAPYVAAGQEVAMLATAIPPDATAANLEAIFAAHAAALPQAVAVVDLPEGGFQENGPLATRVIPIIKRQGRGLLTYDSGLNAADQIARREGLRGGTILRRTDPKGQAADDTGRVLDSAVIRAAQEGRIAAAVEATPATVAALLEWTDQGRAATVALAPATAVMIAR